MAATAPTGAPTGATAGPRVSEVLAAPHFGKVYASGWIWSIARWGMGFLGAYLVNQLTHSPRLVQLSGSFMWAPLLFAGVAGGAVADRFDRRRTVLVQLGVLAPATALIGVLAMTERLATWMVFPFMLLVGLGWIVDMTVRRALIYDLVGAERVNAAMALESFSSAAGLALGAAIGGAVIGLLGVGQAYLVIAGLLAVGFLIMSRTPSPERAAPAARAPFLRTIVEGYRSLPSQLGLVSILGVTFFVDFFHFCYFPLVQVLAERVDATAVQTGLLSASTGLGMMVSSLWVASRHPHRGRAYYWGSVGACVLALGFALSTSYLGALGCMLGAGVAIGLFGATQTALAITAVDAELRGRAMGLLSTAIGSLPVGMYALGELAEAVGAPAALVAFNVTGLVGLLIWARVRPEVLSVR